jgi:hypothetical protein
MKTARIVMLAVMAPFALGLALATGSRAGRAAAAEPIKGTWSAQPTKWEQG